MRRSCSTHDSSHWLSSRIPPLYLLNQPCSLSLSLSLSLRTYLILTSCQNNPPRQATCANRQIIHLEWSLLRSSSVMLVPEQRFSRWSVKKREFLAMKMYRCSELWVSIRGCVSCCFRCQRQAQRTYVQHSDATDASLSPLTGL